MLPFYFWSSNSHWFLLFQRCSPQNLFPPIFNPKIKNFLFQRYNSIFFFLNLIYLFFSLFLETFEVYVCGYNAQGQLGLGHNNSINKFQLLMKDVLSISAGYNHSIVAKSLIFFLFPIHYIIIHKYSIILVIDVNIHFISFSLFSLLSLFFFCERKFLLKLEIVLFEFSNWGKIMIIMNFCLANDYNEIIWIIRMNWSPKIMNYNEIIKRLKIQNINTNKISIFFMWNACKINDGEMQRN